MISTGPACSECMTGNEVGVLHGDQCVARQADSLTATVSRLWTDSGTVHHTGTCYVVLRPCNMS